MKKKILFLLLSLVMVFTAAAAVSYAAENTSGTAAPSRNTETVLEDGSVKTVYGTIPADKTDATAYPVIIFMDGVFKGAESTFASKVDGNNAGAFQVAKTLMDNDSERNNKVQLYLRNDITINARNSNTGQMSGTLTVDLNGYTANCGGYMMYNAEGKKYSEIYPLHVITKNGNITTKAPLLNCTAYGSAYGDLTTPIKTMTFDFENVKITRSGGTLDFLGKYAESTSITTGKKTDVPVNFRNCEFDLTGLPAGVTIFNALDPDITQCHNVLKVTVEGCVFKMNDANAFDWYNLTEGNGSFVKFVPDKNGNYPIVILPKDAPAPEAKLPVENGEMLMVKSDETEDSKIYKIGVYSPSDFGFKLKTSITLDTNVILNIYASEKALVSFEVGGESYTDLSALKSVEVGGEKYYHVSVPLAAAEMAAEISFKANLNSESVSESFTYTLSVPKYAKKLLADDGVSANTKVLVGDILAYARAAYEYFEGDAEGILNIDEVLDKDYFEISKYEGEGKEPELCPDIDEATFVLGENPSMRFYLPYGEDPASYEFFVNGKKINTVYDAENNFISTDVYAYELRDTVSYTYKGEAKGSYCVENYLYFASVTANDEKLVTLFERFIKYLESAKVYRLEFLGDTSVAHVHKYFERSFEISAETPAYDESVCACGDNKITQHTGIEFGDERVSVYFLGNSYTNYNDMSGTFGQIASSMGIDVEVTKRTKGGWHLWKYANKNDTGGELFYQDLEAYDFDYAFLQDGSTQTLAAIAEFYDGVRLVGELLENDGAEILLYQTWGRKEGHAVLETYNHTPESMARFVAAAYEAIAAETGYTLSPVGSAFFDVYTNHPEIELYDPDLTHPSPTGSYLVALCHYATLFGRSPIGVKYTAGLDAETALILQTAAYNAIYGESIVTDEYKTSSEGIHVAKAENNLYELPEGAELISAGITGDNGSCASSVTVAKDAALTEEQKADLSNIAYGVSIIGNKNMVTSLARAADGAWGSSRVSFDFDENYYDVTGRVDMHEPYKALITYNFGGIVNIQAIGYMSGNMDGFAQTQDIYISNDGISWSVVKSASYDAVLLKKDGGSLHSLDMLPQDKNGATSGVCAAFDVNSAEGGVYAKYIRFAIKEGVVVSNKQYDINTLEIAVWGKAANGNLAALPEDSVLLSKGLTASEEFSATAEDSTLAELTAEQKADIADMSKYGMTLIGAKTLERSIKYGCDGVWSGNNRLSAVFYDDETTPVRYDISGNETADGKYECLITYNFGKKVTLDAIGYMSGDLNGFAQNQEIWVSNDGVNWTKLSIAGFNRAGGDTIASVSNKPIDSKEDGGIGKASAQCVMFDMGGVKAQYVRVAIIDGMAEKYAKDLNTYELAVYGKKS
ncbi:MAG: hypothetical protein E7673_03470 [Ruminococcaceae bacterium]|nr:hypothetical protein [Oscillospiraceae bacterium]